MQQVLKLILILMITTTCGQNNEDTTITPPEDEEGSTVVASQEDSTSFSPSHKAVGLSDKDRKELGNMVLVDLLCVKLNPTVIPSCVINRKKLDAFLLMKKHLLGTHQISLDPESLGNGIPPSSTPHSRSTEDEPVGLEVGGNPDDTGLFSTNLLSLLGQRSVPFGQSPSNWTNLFSVFSTILKKAPQLKVPNLDFPGLKNYLINHQLGENSLQTLLGLVISKSVTLLHAKLNQTSARVEKPLAAIGKVEMYSVLAFGVLLAIAIMMCLCWVSQNVATWKEKRKARKELRRQARASRFLHGLQQARYRQQAGEADVRLMSA